MNKLNDSLPNIIPHIFSVPDFTDNPVSETPVHAPRILMLYGSVRERSYSRLATEEGARLLTAMGAEVRIFNPSGLPLPDDAPDTGADLVIAGHRNRFMGTLTSRSAEYVNHLNVDVLIKHIYD